MYEELLKYSSREEVDILRQAVGQQILEIQERSDEWEIMLKARLRITFRSMILKLSLHRRQKMSRNKKGIFEQKLMSWKKQ